MSGLWIFITKHESPKGDFVILTPSKQWGVCDKDVTLNLFGAPCWLHCASGGDVIMVALCVRRIFVKYTIAQVTPLVYQHLFEYNNDRSQLFVTGMWYETNIRTTRNDVITMEGMTYEAGI